MSSFDSYFDKIFIINLDSRVDRWISTVGELEKNGITNYERFSAIRIRDHKSIDPILYNNCHLTPLANNFHYHIGMVGCKLSHIAIISMAKKRGYKRILILEDDIVFKSNAESLFKKSVSQLPDWDMLYLGGTVFVPNVAVADKTAISRAHGILTTSSYALDNSNGIFDFILEHLPTYGGEVDVFYVYSLQMDKIPQSLKKYSVGVKHKFKTYITNPPIVSQGGSKSDILPSQRSINPFHGQFKQDSYCYENFLKDIVGGTFLDIGASDGVRFSNTHFFEKEKEYTGLCIEPRKTAFEQLIANRTCNCENIAIDVENKDAVDFQELFGYGSGLSGIVHNYDQRHVQRIHYEKENPNHKGSAVIKVCTRKIQDILDKYDLHNIDFFSLDTEGGELKILQSIDWKKVHVKVITVENNCHDSEFKRFLTDKGFVFQKRIECDEIYVHSDHLASLQKGPSGV